MAKKKNNRKRTTGWAKTKSYPHERHPATYRCKGTGNDDIEYITFTHSKEVDFGKKKVRTVPMSDNVSRKEREENKQKGRKFGENRSYAYPKVFVGKRSALHKETDEFDPVEFDKRRIGKMFDIFPRENVPVTGSKSKHRQRQKKKPRR